MFQQFRSTFLLDILPKVNLKSVSEQRNRIFKMQGVDNKKRRKQNCNNCVYSPLTILANRIKGEKKEMILVNSGGLFENAQKKKRGERKIRGCNKIMN